MRKHKRALRKKITNFLIIYFLIFTLNFTSNTFSKYIGRIEGNGKMDVAKWDVAVDNELSTKSISLVSGNKTQEYSFEVRSNSETAAKYDVILTNVPDDVKVSIDGHDLKRPTNNEVKYINVGAFKANDTVRTKTHVLKFITTINTEIQSNTNIGLNVVFVQDYKIADRTGISVGDYITYTSPTASVSLSTTETGYSSAQTLSRKNTFRVMEIKDDGSMVLMGAMTAQDDNIYFTGGLGYNNGVYTLNTKCNELYKDDTRGITARSIKMEDITDKFNDYANSKITDCLDYNFGDLSVESQISSLNEENRTATYENSAYSFATYYPDIIQYEEGCAIDNVPTQGIIGESDIYSGYNYNGKTGLTNLGMVNTYPTSLTLPYTYYDIDGEYRDFADTENAGAFNNMFYGTGTKYYLASRCIGLAPPFAYFNLRTINGNGIDASLMRTSDNEDYGSPSSGKVCPIVYIPSDVEIDISANPKNQNNTNGVAHIIN